MYKIFVLTIALCAAVAAAAPAGEGAIDLENSEDFNELSEFKIKPADDDEIAFLSAEHGLFADYCRQSRDLVFKYIQDKNAEIVSNIFATFFGSIGEVTQQLEEIQAAEAQKATEAIKNGVAPLPEDATREDAEEHVEKSVGLLRTIGGALGSYARALGQAAMKELMARLALLRNTVSTENFKELITETCTNVQLVLQRDLQNLFKDSKAAIANDADVDKATKEIIAQATYDKVGCLTTSRTRKVNNFCSVFSSAGPLIFTMMGI